MKKIAIDEAIVVEGRDDEIALLKAVDSARNLDADGEGVSGEGDYRVYGSGFLR